MLDILLMVVIGGMGTMYGAVDRRHAVRPGAELPAGPDEASRAAARRACPLLPSLLHPDRWLLWLGVLFILSVYFFPTGIVGRLQALKLGEPFARVVAVPVLVEVRPAEREVHDPRVGVVLVFADQPVPLERQLADQPSSSHLNWCSSSPVAELTYSGVSARQRALLNSMTLDQFLRGVLGLRLVEELALALRRVVVLADQHRLVRLRSIAARKLARCRRGTACRSP